MKKILALAILGISLWGCSGSNQKEANKAGDQAKDQNTVVISNDLENALSVIPSWSNEKTVVKMEGAPAHSGQYVTLVDDKFVYSYAFREFIDNIDQRIPKKVTVKGWVYSTVASPDLSIIMDISENNSPIDWKAYSLTSTVKEANSWIPFKANFNIDKPIQSSNLIKLFAWNPGKKAAYLDDFEVTFEY
ncbi:MAG TPA: hypothetical protein PLJ84_10560 [Bacteroidales bacterium]|nr:hypothetical protein [Bacteroidales bacterium]HPT03028.1 hypothetical protein [Bacteroidales bacterium]